MTENLEPREILKSDILPIHLAPNETAIIIQRHEKYIRDPENPKLGSLEPEANEQLEARTRGVITAMLEKMRSP